MAKNIAFFFEGTWHTSYSENVSNVVRLCTATQSRNHKGEFQLVYYHRGVGTGTGTFATSRFLDKISGGAFASGLKVVVADTYRELVLNYEVGDRIYVFGWSRGAYTALRFVKLIEKIGIVRPQHIADIPKLVNWELSAKPAELTLTDKFEHVLNKPVAYPNPLLLRLMLNTMAARREFKARKTGAPSYRKPSFSLEIEFLGLWDCVSAVGLPWGLNKLAGLHRELEPVDFKLPRFVRSCWHAVALDETRKIFPVDLIENMEQLRKVESNKSENTQEGGRNPQDRFRQQYFPGGHGAIGGSPDLKPIGQTTLRWIAEGAKRAGLNIDWSAIGIDRSDEITIGEAQSKPGIWLLNKQRELPNMAENISKAAQKLKAREPEYWPNSDF